MLSSTHLSGYVTTRGSVLVGGELWDSVTVVPNAVRTVSVQYRRSGTAPFTTAATLRSSASGAFAAGLRPPGAGTWQFRLVVAASTTATAFTSPTRVVVASGHAAASRISGFVSTPASVILPGTSIDNIVVTPPPARFVYVQARRPGSAVFATVSSGISSATGNFKITYHPTTPGVWVYRVFVRGNATALPVTSPSRQITALDRTPPGPVTALGSGITASSVTLSWTNPTAADFAGVMIRRATGPTAPASPTSGVLVTKTGAAAKTFTNTALSPSTTYSYALFSFDAAQNLSAGRNVTVTTNAVTTAAITLVAFGSGKVTQGELATFDATASQAATGLILSTATLDFGDGTPAQVFTGDPATWQVEHAFATLGSKTATLTVTDSAAQTATGTVSVMVFAAPTDSITGGPGVANQAVTFTVAASTPVGTVFTEYDVSYDNATTTAFVDGTPPATLTHTFTVPGTYVVILDVFNNAGGFARSTITVTVT